MFSRVGGSNANSISSNSGGLPQNPNAQYETIFEIATKRMATLDYLRRAHEGRVYWFNTVLFTKSDLAKGIYNDPKKLAKRATNYFILGCSIPNILDLGTSPLDYLKAFNQLFQEYESYSSQNHDHAHHGTSGSSGGLRSTVRIGKIFSRATKPRRASSAASSLAPSSAITTITSPQEISYPSVQHSLERERSLSGSSVHLSSNSQQSLSSDSSDPPPVPPLPATTPQAPTQHTMQISSPFPNYPSSSTAPVTFGPTNFGTTNISNGDSEYLYLTVPPLPFDPDFFETFTTLCDVLIDAYSRVLSLVASPQQCGAGVGESFLKVDSKVRKCVVTGVVKDLEEASRGAGLGIKGEIGSIGKLVLGAL